MMQTCQKIQICKKNMKKKTQQQIPPRASDVLLASGNGQALAVGRFVHDLGGVGV